jgi:hypothetical protein
MPTLAEFKANFASGARPTLYQVTLNFPAAVASGDASRKFQFTCKAASLPGQQSGTILVPYMGRKIKLAGDREFADMQVTVINDSDWVVRTAFERWMQMINGHAENVGATRLADYSVDMLLEQLDRSGAVIATYTLIGAFPTVVDPIGLSYEAVDQVEEFGVTLSYQWWTRAEAGVV